MKVWLIQESNKKLVKKKGNLILMRLKLKRNFKILKIKKDKIHKKKLDLKHLRMTTKIRTKKRRNFIIIKDL